MIFCYKLNYATIYTCTAEATPAREEPQNSSKTTVLHHVKTSSCFIGLSNLTMRVSDCGLYSKRYLP